MSVLGSRQGRHSAANGDGRRHVSSIRGTGIRRPENRSIACVQNPGSRGRRYEEPSAASGASAAKLQRCAASRHEAQSLRRRPAQLRRIVWKESASELCLPLKRIIERPRHDVAPYMGRWRVGWHDDLAHPSSGDGQEKQETRRSGVVSMGGRKAGELVSRWPIPRFRYKDAGARVASDASSGLSHPRSTSEPRRRLPGARLGAGSSTPVEVSSLSLSSTPALPLSSAIDDRVTCSTSLGQRRHSWNLGDHKAGTPDASPN
jgi:hypothetical protein